MMLIYWAEAYNHIKALVVASKQIGLEVNAYKTEVLDHVSRSECRTKSQYTRVGTLIVATIYLQLIQNRYMFRSFTVLHCSHQRCLQPVASDVEVVGYL